MSILIVETGQRPTGANSYVTLAESFDTYIPLYANDPSQFSTYDSVLAEQSLVKAAKALDDLYGQLYLGFVFPNVTQSLLFPRSVFYDNNGRLVKQLSIPNELKNAQTELAMLIYNGLDPYVTKNKDSKIKSKTVSVDRAISSSITYTTPVEDEIFTGMLRVERVLSPILQIKKQINRIHL
jgi:hypothetical protein